MQEMLLPDGDLHGEARNRKFRWKHIGKDRGYWGGGGERGGVGGDSSGGAVKTFKEGHSELQLT